MWYSFHLIAVRSPTLDKGLRRAREECPLLRVRPIRLRPAHAVHGLVCPLHARKEAAESRRRGGSVAALAPTPERPTRP
eukprot:1187086-Prorocentrum_minimum.AAC.5